MPKSKVFLIQDIQKESPDVFTFICFYEDGPLRFLPGQFLVAQRYPDGKRASVTFSSAPSDPNGFSFTLKRMGEFGTDFCDKVKVGDPVAFIGPTGPFAMDIHQREPICFLCRDYTSSAARSALLERELEREKTGRVPRGRFFLLHELSAPSEEIFGQEFRKGSPGFFYLPTLDPESGESSRDYPKSRLTAEFVKNNVPNFEATEFYICAEGVDAKFYKAELQKLGISKDKIHLERWS